MIEKYLIGKKYMNQIKW